ncbi:MAG: MogA/MoaB family molybdenum cofactor biosynthesis protein, partial [Anaerolineales bacterium]
MSIKFAILTVSDRSSSGTREDRSGPLLQQAVIDSGWEVKQTDIVSDEFPEIVDKLQTWSDSGEINVILTTGGTGFSSRDVTPEATKAVVDRQAPGLAEAMRAGSLTITPHAMLSRSEAGIRKNTLIINLPGSPKGALENFRIVAPVLAHAVQLLEDDREAEDSHQRPLA